jgi:DNA-binding MarR family transcriptional regulator
VRRKTSSLDGRRVELALTSRGTQLLARAPHAAQDRLIEGLEALPLGQRIELAAALRQLVQSMQLSHEQPGMFFEDDEAQPKSKGERRAR